MEEEMNFYLIMKIPIYPRLKTYIPQQKSHMNDTCIRGRRNIGSITNSVQNAHFTEIQGEQMVKKIKQGAVCQTGLSSGGNGAIYPYNYSSDIIIKFHTTIINTPFITNLVIIIKYLYFKY